MHQAGHLNRVQGISLIIGTIHAVSVDSEDRRVNLGSIVLKLF